MVETQASSPPTPAHPEWARLSGAGTTGALPGEGLRERKKRLMRQLLSDTATEMFLERGFDEVRVAEIAAACGVSEKTVYNYFATKEDLLLDREEAMAEAVRKAASDTKTSPVEAMVSVLMAELHSITEALAEQDEGPLAMTMVQRFTDLVESTPSLRAHQRDSMDRLVAIAAEALAERAGLSPEDPEPQVAAHALIGLWRIYFLGLKRYCDGQHNPQQVADLVGQELRRAARLTDTGLWSFGVFVQGTDGTPGAQRAAMAAEQARAQVRTTLLEAKQAWRALRTMAKEREAAERVDHVRRRRR
jgi:AcrR family transcriptional regulator